MSPTLSLKEAADYLKRSPAHLYRLAKRGAIPGHKPDGKWIFLQNEIEAWVTSRERVQKPSLSKFQQVRERHRSLKTEVTPIARTAPRKELEHGNR